jgi:hypothetical protein
MPNEDWVFWLVLTNIAMVVVVLLVASVLAYTVISEVLSRRKRPHGEANLNEEMNTSVRDEFTHSLPVPELGMTMADGGERAKPSLKQPAEKKPS